MLFMIPFVVKGQKDENIELKINAYNAVVNSDTGSVSIKLEIINKGNERINIYCWKGITITQAINSILNFVIFNDNDTLVYNYVGPQVKLPYENDFTVIKPDSTFVEIIDLNKYYILKTDKDNSRNWKKGIYDITCIYEYKHNKKFKYGSGLWEARLVSNKIRLEVE